MYKKLILIFVYLSLATHLYSQENLSENFVVTYDFESAREIPAKIFIQQFSIAGMEIKSDTVLSFNKQTNFLAKLKEPTYFIFNFFWKNKKFTTLKFWITSGKTTIRFTEDLDPMIVTENNSFFEAVKKIDTQVADYQQKADDLVSQVNYENRKISEVETQIWKIRDSIDKVIDHDIYFMNIIKNLDSPVGLYALWKYADRPVGKARFKSSPLQIDSLIKLLAPNIKSLPSTDKLISVLRLEKDQELGKPIKEVELVDALGKTHNLKNFRGKYVLIDFWASWCLPCRAEHPNLVQAYKKYRTSGFEIISITRDNISRRSEWLEAIKQDKISAWLHLSDFKNIAQKTYNIQEIPMNFLIDPQGKIISKNLRGDQLIVKLSEILKSKFTKKK